MQTVSNTQQPLNDDLQENMDDLYLNDEVIHELDQNSMKDHCF